MSDSSGVIIVVVAPSGTGKSTLISKLKEENSFLTESVSFTTRGKRPGEIDGVHYHFVSEEEFLNMKKREEFLEWALVHGDYKGTSKKFVRSKLDEGSCLLFDLDVQGSDSMKAEFGDLAKIIFISPPSFEELEKRLRERKTETEEKIKVRLENARSELKRRDDYDYVVVNDDFDKAYSELSELVKKISGES